MSNADVQPNSGVSGSTDSAEDPRQIPPPLPPAPVPPPPPPRSTLPPVKNPARNAGAVERKITDITSKNPEPPSVPSGVGSAKSLRWKGELGRITEEAEKQEAEESEKSALDKDEALRKINRSAPPWLISTIIHLIVMLILVFISTPVGKNIGKVVLEFGNAQRKEEVELAEFEVVAEQPVEEASDELAEAEIDINFETVFDVPTDSDFDTSQITPVEFGSGPAIEISKPMFGGRRGAMKKVLLAMYGGTPQTQEAVELGLQWVVKQQKRDGSWSMRGPYSDGAFGENNCAATAMALLALMGDGNTHHEGPYAKNVEKGVQYLMKLQNRSGFMAARSRGHEKTYAQAQATIALCELYAMTKDSALRARAQAAVDYAQESQGREGGWRYYPKGDSDTSVTGWYVMALQSAISAELEVDREVFYKVNHYLDLAQEYEGAAYAYQPGSRISEAMTAEGLLCRQYLGWKHDTEAMAQGIEALLIDKPFSLRDGNVYYWYYATQVMHHFGGEPWTTWNEVMRKELPEAQIVVGKESGSWAPQNDVYGDFGRLYTTCLSLYCLEVYYRHMPLYDQP